MSARVTSAIARLRRRGFTLVELLVAMVAGLLVALAIVSLSKEANTTFQEETRVAGAEAQLRTAIDRLRSDLQRASFMSTANLLGDPQVAHNMGNASNANMPATMTALRGLQGIRLRSGGSAATAPLSATAQNGLNPDSIDLAGNFTTVEQFPIQSIDTATNPCGGQRLILDIDSSPAMWRLLGMSEAGASTGTYDKALQLAFQPIFGVTGADGGAANGQFMVRVGDATGYYQYLATCKDSQAAGWSSGKAYIDLDSSTPLLSNAQLGGSGAARGGITGNCMGGTCTVNPVQIVRWQIGAAVVNPTSDGAKYDLTRQYLDVRGQPVGPAELIAEYAVDMKFAFTVDSNSNGDTTGNAAKQTVFGFESTANPNSASYGADITTPAGKSQFPGPQRIRSVRVRLATRAAVADRSQGMDAGANYTFRYCAALGADGGSATCTNGSTGWARARTIVTEVSLPNQARLYWP